MAILSELDKKLVISKCWGLLEVFSNESIEIKVWKSSHFKVSRKILWVYGCQEKADSYFSQGSRKKYMSGIKMMDCSVACSVWAKYCVWVYLEHSLLTNVKYMQLFGCFVHFFLKKNPNFSS